MRILADQRIRALFSRIGICIGVFISLSAVMSISLGAKAQLLGIFLISLCTAAAILTFCSIYFREQDKILEDAAAQIKDYIAGDLDARIACDGEGELYHLFHQINSLAAIPPLPILQAQVLGTMLAPITGLAVVLKQIAEKQGGGDAAGTPAEEAAPAAE